MDINKYSVFLVEIGVIILLGKVFKDGFNQLEFVVVYDDVSKDYDKVFFRVYIVGEFFCCLYVYYFYVIFIKEMYFCYNDIYFNYFFICNLIFNFYLLFCIFKVVIISNL